MKPLPPTASNNMPLISLKGSFSHNNEHQINGYTWLDLFRNMALLSPNMHLAEPLTPHTVSRNTNRKLRHCEFTRVHLDHGIASGYRRLGRRPHQSLLSGKTEKLYLQRGWTLHLYKYNHYKTAAKVCDLVGQRSWWAPNWPKTLMTQNLLQTLIHKKENQGNILPKPK